MSLDRFTKHRLVVQSPRTRIYDAVRAMEDNAVGAVLVHDGERLVGIVTDRDMSLKVIGDDLDPFEFQLRDVMSAPVACVAADATVADAAEIMAARHVRRVPVMNGAKVLGIVTLDDLILEHAVDAPTLAAIVRGQLAEPSRLKAKGRLHPTAAVRGDREALRLNLQRRHDARRRQVYAKLVKRTADLTELDSAEEAEHALLIVISALLRRLTPEEAADFLAQLPSSLRDYAIANVPGGPDLAVRRALIEDQVVSALGVGQARAAQIVRQVGRALCDGISRGELNDVKGQLPPDLKEILDVAGESRPSR